MDVERHKNRNESSQTFNNPQKKKINIKINWASIDVKQMLTIQRLIKNFEERSQAMDAIHHLAIISGLPLLIEGVN